MKHLLIHLLIWLPLATFAQKMPDYGIYHIRISDTDKTIQAEIIPVTSMPDVKPELEYYWYGANTIHRLQGGFSGQLLNGTYNEYYKNKNLKTQGLFEKGLKNGEWKDWYEDGKLNRLITWEKGIQSGRFSLYNPDGKIIQSGRYRHNQLDGPVTYNAGTDSLKVIRYKNGQIVPAKSGTFLKRVNIFKKKTTPQAKPAT
jgi:antitoxin component YwqK of YwqJK toxin-antitoxin module